MRDKEIRYLCEQTMNDYIVRRLVATSSLTMWHLVASWCLHRSECCVVVVVVVVLWPWHCVVAVALA